MKINQTLSVGGLDLLSGGLTIDEIAIACHT